MGKPLISTALERGFWKFGNVVAGVDEAGRGALAGPVVAAAVILHPDRIPEGIDDSKLLSPGQRETVSLAIKEVAIAWSVGFVDHLRVDEVNVLQATFDAMHEAINGLLPDNEPAYLLIDGNRFRPHTIEHSCIIDGDAISVSIAAASIIAKTTRDAWMVNRADTQWPVYGFASHKGYGTARHRQAVAEHGPCEIHRRTFLKTDSK